MKTGPAITPVLAVSLFFSGNFLTQAGTWTDHFALDALNYEWRGDRDFFVIIDGRLAGQSATPLAPSPLNTLEVGDHWSNYVVRCWMNVVRENTRVCTKGALVLRRNGDEGYVFALHEATQTVEVYRLSDHEMLLSKSVPIELQKWYRVRAELQGPAMSFFVDDALIGTLTDARSSSGTVGVAVQDADEVLFDDFTVTGPDVSGNIDDITPPEITDVRRDGDQLVLKFLASPPYRYTVQVNSSPDTPWQDLTNFTAKLQSFEAVASDTLVSGGKVYRVEKTPCDCR